VSASARERYRQRFGALTLPQYHVRLPMSREAHQQRVPELKLCGDLKRILTRPADIGFGESITSAGGSKHRIQLPRTHRMRR
jgi:hypothetical protein